MKKKILLLMLAFVFALPCSFALAGCKDNDPANNVIALADNMLYLEYYSTYYNGEEQKPGVVVEVNETVIPASEYGIAYSNNINTGTAEVVVSANASSALISGSASANFVINATRINVSTYEDLKAVLTNNNYSTISITENITIPAGETLTIPAKKTVNCGSYKLNIEGNLVNEGNIKINIASKDEFNEAINYANNLTLVNDIDLNGSYLTIDAATRDYNVNVELDGNSILGQVKVYGKSTYSASVSIRDSKQTGTVGTETASYGITAIGGNINLSLFGLNVVSYYAAIATNGSYEGASISAINCTFTGVSTETGSESGNAAYLPAKNSYSFVNCTFTGGTAYYAKSGNHTLINCSFNGTQSSYVEPKHNGTASESTGSALVINSAEGYKQPLTLTIYNATFSSISGYAIEEFCSGDVEDYSTTSYYGTLTYLNPAKGNIKVWDSSVE